MDHSEQEELNVSRYMKEWIMYKLITRQEIDKKIDNFVCQHNLQPMDNGDRIFPHNCHKCYSAKIEEDGIIYTKIKFQLFY